MGSRTAAIGLLGHFMLSGQRYVYLTSQIILCGRVFHVHSVTTFFLDMSILRTLQADGVGTTAVRRTLH